MQTQEHTRTYIWIDYANDIRTPEQKAQDYEAAMKRARDLMPIIQPLRRLGTGLRSIAAELNRIGLVNEIGNPWTSRTVRKIIRRIDWLEGKHPKQLH